MLTKEQLRLYADLATMYDRQGRVISASVIRALIAEVERLKAREDALVHDLGLLGRDLANRIAALELR